MTGGLMQLVATGSQDIYLTGNPQITFFKSIYRRYTNFASEIVEKFFEGTRISSLQSLSSETVNIDFDNTYTVKFSKDGDLIHKIYIKLILGKVIPNANEPSSDNNCFAWVKRIGHAIIDEVDISLGGTIIDRQYGTWLDIWYELARVGDHERGYANMIGDISELTEYNNEIKNAYTLYIPLQFWFNRYVGLSIPLIALQYQDIRLRVRLAKKENVIIKSINFDDTVVKLLDGSVLTNYIFLDTEERRIFAQTAHEYLIEQVQFNGIYDVTDSQQRFTLDYKHPTKEIIWALRLSTYNNALGFLYYSSRDQWTIDINTINILTGEQPLNIVDGSEKIVLESIFIGEDPPNPIDWQPIYPNGGKYDQNNHHITNNSTEIAWFNPESTVITSGVTSTNLLDKIAFTVVIGVDKLITFITIDSSITVRDFSFDLDYFNGSRVNNNVTLEYYNLTTLKIKQADPYLQQPTNYGILIDGSVNPVQYGQLKLNGHDRFDKREGLYFNNVQPYQHHSNTPKDGINVYSFSLYPEQHQPSGTANLSRIDDTQLILWFNDSSFRSGLPTFDSLAGKLYAYATNYNILRIMSGMGGIAYPTS